MNGKLVFLYIPSDQRIEVAAKEALDLVPMVCHQYGDFLALTLNGTLLYINGGSTIATIVRAYEQKRLNMQVAVGTVEKQPGDIRVDGELGRCWTPASGTNIRDAAREAIHCAAREDDEIALLFEGIVVRVQGYMTVQDVENAYNRSIEILKLRLRGGR